MNLATMPIIPEPQRAKLPRPLQERERYLAALKEIEMQKRLRAAERRERTKAQRQLEAEQLREEARIRFSDIDPDPQGAEHFAALEAELKRQAKERK